MSDMIETVARAIDPEGWAYHEVYLKIKEADAEMARDFRDRSARIQRSLRNARAAIEAMREPGLAIRKITTFEFAEVEWPQLIDAALSQDTNSLPTPAATPTDSANPPPVESVGPNSTGDA